MLPHFILQRLACHTANAMFPYQILSVFGILQTPPYVMVSHWLQLRGPQNFQDVVRPTVLRSLRWKWQSCLKSTTCETLAISSQSAIYLSFLNRHSNTFSMSQDHKNRLWEMENFKEGKVPSNKLQAFHVLWTQMLQYDGPHSSPEN